MIKEGEIILKAHDELKQLLSFYAVTGRAFETTTNLVAQHRAQRRLALLIKSKSGIDDAELSERDLSALPDDIFEEYIATQAVPLEKFAKQELSKGTPYVHCLCVIKLWSILEAAVDDVVGLRLLTAGTQKNERIKRLKGPLIDFISLSDDDKAEYLVELLKQDLGAALQPGVGRFEGLLDAVGLGGPVDDDVRFALMEVSQIRHAVVHRNGIADTKLFKHCERLPYKKGDKIDVTSSQLIVYTDASFLYLLEAAKKPA